MKNVTMTNGMRAICTSSSTKPIMGYCMSSRYVEGERALVMIRHDGEHKHTPWCEESVEVVADVKVNDFVRDEVLQSLGDEGKVLSIEGHLVEVQFKHQPFKSKFKNAVPVISILWRDIRSLRLVSSSAPTTIDKVALTPRSQRTKEERRANAAKHPYVPKR